MNHSYNFLTSLLADIREHAEYSYRLKISQHGIAYFETPCKKQKFLTLLLSEVPWSTDPSILSREEDGEEGEEKKEVRAINSRLFYLPLIRAILQSTDNPWRSKIEMNSDNLSQEQWENLLDALCSDFGLERIQAERVAKGSSLNLLSMKAAERASDPYYVSYVNRANLRLESYRGEVLEYSRFSNQPTHGTGYYLRTEKGQLGFYIP